MSKTAEQLRSLKPGKSGRVRGQDVKRNGDLYLIEGDEYSLDEAAKRLDQAAPAKSGTDYDWTVFLESPPGTCYPIKHHRCRNKAEHAELLEAVRKRNNYLWYGGVVKVEGKYQNRPPFLIDWDSVPDHPTEAQKQEEKPKDPKRWDCGLSCPFCAVTVSSTPGRTLHVKSQHPERFEEYQGLLAGKAAPAKRVEEDDDDVVSRQAESEDGDGLKCPFCGKMCTSRSGLTLHVNSVHT